jgi:hypothetical protein
MTSEQLAALDRAATQGELIDLATLPDQIQSLRNHAEERRGKGWLKSAANLEASAYLIETLAAEVAKYRTGKLVLINDGAVERVAVPVAWCYVNPDGECEQIDWGASDLSKMAGDPGITPLYSAPPKQHDQSARAEAAEARVARLREALTRQADNMDFVLNHFDVFGQWYIKFRTELEEDRTALEEPSQ